MKMKYLTMLLLCSSLYVANTYAEGNEGGGGNEVVADFARQAFKLTKLKLIDESDRAILTEALNKTRIITVTTLMDPNTGRPIANQTDLVAWGTEGLIQIKNIPPRRGWGSPSSKIPTWPILGNYFKRVHLIFHELYRASGIKNEFGLSPDENYQLSVGKYKLHKYYDTDITDLLNRQDESTPPPQPPVSPLRACADKIQGQMYSSDQAEMTRAVIIKLCKEESTDDIDCAFRARDHRYEHTPFSFPKAVSLCRDHRSVMDCAFGNREDYGYSDLTISQAIALCRQ